jgi:hypothetical protein
MRMQKVYLLIFFSLWCQFDDVLLTPFPSLQSAPLADDDEEYVSVERPQDLKWSSSFSKSRPGGLNPKTSDFLSISARTDLPPSWKLTEPIRFSCLYALMSLQL